MAKDPLEDQTLPSREAAERTAKMIGCTGAHKMPNGWQPCESHEGLMILIRRGVVAYRKHRDGTKTAKRIITSQALEEELEEERKRKRGIRKRRYVRNERLGERGVYGFDATGAGITGIRKVP